MKDHRADALKKPVFQPHPLEEGLKQQKVRSMSAADIMFSSHIH